MRLKQLSLQGYKSFASKTEFVFSDGITAVVGPNGSGKSNVADAVRWALGEQSMRVLRGKSTSDMIFGGGRHRARSGMAEASLVLDNSDGWLPIEFSELAVTRRAYRSGENEYLVNGSRVRLRDIAGLLAESGLSQRAYAVIGQGLVDAALSLRPQERRMLFEEAAGISLYRVRREEAVSRLDETQRNLERVGDIISEIAPRLRRLEREAERAVECRRVTAHLKRLQHTWYGYQWGRSQTALTSVLRRASAIEASLKGKQGQLASLSGRLMQLRQNEYELRASMRDWHRQRTDLRERAGDGQRELAVTEERLRLLRARREELLNELVSLRAQQEAQNERVDQASAEVERLRLDLAGRKRRLAPLEQEWAAVRVQARVDQHNRELPRRRRQPVELGQEQEAAKEGERRPTADHTRLKHELDARSVEWERLNQALMDARADAGRLAGQLDMLSRLHSEKGSPSAGAQMLLQADPEGVLGPLITLMEVPREWECAIEAALGDGLRAIVVDRASLVEEARRIVDSVGGRMLLLPLDTLRPPPAVPPGATRAAGLVSCAANVRPAVEATLGAVALCSDLTEALALLSDMPPGSCCVTLEGVVVRADGAFQVGTVGIDGALGAERVHREISLELDTVHRRCQEIQTLRETEANKIAGLEAEIRQLDAIKDAATVEWEALASTRTEAAVAEESLRGEQARMRRELALLERLQTQTSGRVARTEEMETECATLWSRIQELRAEASTLEAQLNETRKRIQTAEKELVPLGDVLQTLDTQERQARERARDAEGRNGQAQLEVERHRDRMQLLAHRIEEDLGLVELELTEGVTAQTPLPLRPLVSDLPVVEELPEGLEEEIQRLKARLRRLRGVNPNAPEEFAETKERHRFLSEQAGDLETATAQLRQAVAELDELMEAAFRETFDAVAAEFSQMFTTLFNGGQARLELTDVANLMSTGVDIVAQPPGKRAQRLALLSSGERALTAVALLFSLLRVSPTPFCVLDEVDAMLDEVNVGRFRTLLEEMAQETQFVVITHNRVTVEAADTIYGVSMGAAGVSQVVSLKMD